MITVKNIDFNSEAYRELALKKGSVFNQAEWLQLYGDRILVLGLYNLNDELIGAFNFYKAIKFGMAYLIVPPYSPSNGLFFINPAENNSNRITFEKAVHESICKWLNAQRVLLKISAFPFTTNDTQVYFWNKYKVIPNYSYRLSLDQSAEQLFSGLTSEKRKSVRRAEKDKIEIKLCEDYQIVKELILKTFDRKDKKVSMEFLDKILFKFATKENSFAYVAYQNNKPSGCTYCLISGDTTYYLFGGYDISNKHHGSGVSCMWHSILHAKDLGLKIFDFEGSMLPEVEKYFREFGGDLVPYYTIQKAWLLVEMALKLAVRNRF